MKTRKFFGVVLEIGAVSALLFGVGCGLFEPGDSTPKANQAPETVITSGPRENSTNSYFVRIAWDGQDQDGRIDGFQLTVDNGTIRLGNVTRDSTFKFTAANQDEEHTVSVAAIDDDGDVDPTPAVLRFKATNVPPNTQLEIEGDPAPGATFGRGGVFTVQGIEDPDNGTEFTYRYRIDSGPWSDFISDGVFVFGDGNIVSASELEVERIFPPLPEGEHTVFFQARDAALAVDETPVEFRIVVSPQVKPGIALAPTVHSHALFGDSSAFSFSSGNNVQFSWGVTFNYAGGRSTGTRYRINGGAWSSYSLAVNALELTGVSAGTHTFEIQSRDLAGVESDMAVYRYDIVAPTFDAGVLVVDDNNGNRFARDANVDAFYLNTLAGAGVQKVAQWEIRTSGAPTPKKGMGRYSTVIWESDEAFIDALASQTQLVSDYLTAGGNVWISGWKVFQNTNRSNSLNLNYSPDELTPPQNAAFFWNSLKIATSSQAPATPDFTGAVGQAGHPNVNVDAAKNFSPAFGNRLNSVEILTLRSDVPQAQGIYTYVSNTGAGNFHGQLTGMKYIGTDYKAVIFGFPFYYIKDDEAIAAARTILTEFGEL